MTIEPYARYVSALVAALPVCDGILASTQPLRDLVEQKAVEPRHRTYLSVNRTGLSGSVFELDDFLVASVAEAADEGYTGVKHMTRIDLTDQRTAPALELLGRVLEQARAAGLQALVEALSWRNGRMVRDTDSIVFAAVVAHDMGAPVLKVPVPDVPPGPQRVDAVSRVVSSVGVPVLFLGGPREAHVAVTKANERSAEDKGAGDARIDRARATVQANRDPVRQAVLSEVNDAMAGGAAGMAIGRVLFQDPDPSAMARLVADAVHATRGAAAG
jgi:DhnA family fructose-bisphosphate aldolase class Ia